MPELIACLSTGKGTWGQVSGLIKQGEWDNIILVGNDFARKFTVEGEKKHEFIEISDSSLVEMKQSFLEKLKNKIKGIEVALSIASGNGKENFTVNPKTELLSVNMSQGLKELRDEIHEKLKDRVKDTEVAVNLISGTGKEHMALMSALLKLGVGIRLIAVTKDGVEVI